MPSLSRECEARNATAFINSLNPKPLKVEHSRSLSHLSVERIALDQTSGFHGVGVLGFRVSGVEISDSGLRAYGIKQGLRRFKDCEFGVLG